MCFALCPRISDEAKMPVHKGDLIEVTFDRLSYKGYGIGRYDGREVSVAGALPGEHGEVQVVRKPRHRIVGELVRTVSSPYPRHEARCPHFRVCGGCWWQDVAYPAQLQLKERIVRGYLAPWDDEAVWAPILPSPEAWGYRNKMEFSFDRGREGEFQLGLHLRGRFDQLFDLQECALAPPVFSEIAAFVRGFARSRGLLPYDQRREAGLLRFLTIREGRRTGEHMVVLTAVREEGALTELAEALRERFPSIRGVLFAHNDRPAQVAYGDTERVLSGEPKIREVLKVGGTSLTFELSFRSFLQTNTLAAERLYEVVLDSAVLSGTERVLDVFCGIGTITGFLALHAREVVGVELVEEAVGDARRNMAANRVENAEFLAGPAEKVLRELPGPFDLIVVDPPRAGVHPKTLRRLKELAAPRLVYVSCNPKTLADDLRVLAETYEVMRVRAVDLFPHTPHVETVVALRYR